VTTAHAFPTFRVLAPELRPRRLQLASRHWPVPGRWLRPQGQGLPDPNCTQLQKNIVLRMHVDLDELEQPLGSNCSPYVNELKVWAGFGATEDVPWCAIWVARVWVDAGATVPRDFASVDNWLPYLVPFDSLSPRQRVGCAIAYGKRGAGDPSADVADMRRRGWDGKHLELIKREHPELTLVQGGNRGYAGLVGKLDLGPNTNNGFAIDSAPLVRTDVLGLIIPAAA
jgi:hypothetical protein